MNVSECRFCVSDTLNYIAGLEKRIAELEETINQLNKADASLRAQNEAQGRNAAASAKRIAELEARVDTYRNAVWTADRKLEEMKEQYKEDALKWSQRIAELEARNKVMMRAMRDWYALEFNRDECWEIIKKYGGLQ